MNDKEERLEMIRMFERSHAWLCLVLGGAIFTLVTGGLVIVKNTNPESFDLLFKSADEACLLDDGTYNQGCMQYFDSITFNIKSVFVTGYIGSFALIGCGIYLFRRK